MDSARSIRATRVGLAALLLVFVVHRVAVALSVGDFILPLEPSEGKHTQIAWDLQTGRFLSDGFGLGAYISNSGTVHHGSYSTCAAVYVLVSAVLGFDLLSVRITPLLFWVGGIGLIGEALRRRFGPVAALLGALALIVVSTQFIALQLSFTGSHSETILPLALTLFAWAHWVSRPVPTWQETALLGASLGYAAAFSYLLAPILALMGLVTFLPPRPRLDRRRVAAGVAGFAAGMWPIWLIVALEPRALFVNAVTENPETTPFALAAGGGADAALVGQTLRVNLPSGFEDYWMAQDVPRWVLGGAQFEPWAWKVAVLGPLLLLPFAAFERDAARRRLAIFFALAPVCSYLFLAFTTPWKPHIRVRYMVPLLVLGWLAPAVAAGLGQQAWRAGRRRLGAAAVALGALTTLWVAPPRILEAALAVRPERMAQNRQHRLVSYYNLGMSTIWAQDVEAVNDLIDVRSASGDPRQFGGVQPALWAGGSTNGLGRGSFIPEGEVNWDVVRAAMGEWQERQGYLPPGEQDDPVIAAENMGWGLGVRLEWAPEGLAAIQTEAAVDWPPALPWESVWEGFGLGWGRRDSTLGEDPTALPEGVPLEAREAVARGIRRGRSVGAVPQAPIPPVFPSVRGAAT